MIYFYLIGYVIVLGFIFCDEDSRNDKAYRLIKHKLLRKGITVDITLYPMGSVQLTATKQIGNTVKHAVVNSNDLLDATHGLINYVNSDSSEWDAPETY